MTNNNNNKQKIKNLVCEIVDSNIIEYCGFLDMNIYRSEYIDINLHRQSINEETLKTLNRICDITYVFLNEHNDLTIHIRPKGIESATE